MSERIAYWKVDAQGQLQNTLYLTEDEVPYCTGLVTVAPPEESYEQRAFWQDDEWTLVTVAPFPVSASTLEIPADGITPCILTMPAGVSLSSGGVTLTTNGTPVEFVTDTFGTHKFTLKLWPYLDGEVIINAI